MTPRELESFLSSLVDAELRHSLMIWGGPGVGKSSIVRQTASRHGLAFVDLRLSQLAPTDLRGLPVAEDGLSRWYPPEFLPRSGAGILLLDELNMAPPALQGVAQQLVLDRRVGAYEVPPGWFVWAAGNRKEDRAAVFDMPTPLANRFLHLEVDPDFPSFQAYALDRGFHEQILAFLAFRPGLLYQLDARHPAWPSPRSWERADALHAAGLPIGPAVGVAAEAEFRSFLTLYGALPDLDAVLAGDGARVAFPEDPAQRYATVVGLAARAEGAEAGLRGFRWLDGVAGPEWVQVYAVDLARRLRARGQAGALARLLAEDDRFRALLQEVGALLSEA